jgi:hypothetical protein
MGMTAAAVTVIDLEAPSPGQLRPSSFGGELVAMHTNKDVSAYRYGYRGFLRFNCFLAVLDLRF